MIEIIIKTQTFETKQQDPEFRNAKKSIFTYS